MSASGVTISLHELTFVLLIMS